MCCFVRDGRGARAPVHLVGEHTDVSQDAVRFRHRRSILVLASDCSPTVDQHELRIQIEAAIVVLPVVVLEARADDALEERRIGHRRKLPYGGIGPHELCVCRQPFRSVVVGIDRDGDESHGNVTQVDLGEAILNLPHRGIQIATRCRTPRVGEVIENEGSSDVFAGEEVAGLSGESETRSETDTGDDLNRLEDGESRWRGDQEHEDADEDSPLHWRKDTARGNAGTLGNVVSKKFFVPLLILLLVALSGCSGDEEGGLGPDADPGRVPSFIGSHFVAGVDPTGAEYGGRVEITKGADGVYQLEWTVSGTLQQGEGHLHGNVLDVVWSTVPVIGREVNGTAVYVVTVDGGLRGVRYVNGYDGEGTEEIFASHD